MHPESHRAEQQSQHQLAVAYLALLIAILAALATLATVPEVRNYLCRNHQMFIFCPKLDISESEMRVFAWFPQMATFDSSQEPPPPGWHQPPGWKPNNPYIDILPPDRSRYGIPPFEERSYVSRFPSGTQQWLFWEARLKSHRPPNHPIDFEVYWTMYDPGGNYVVGAAVTATWGADDPLIVITGPADTETVRTIGQFPPGHYQIVLKVSSVQLSDREIRSGFDIY